MGVLRPGKRQKCTILEKQPANPGNSEHVSSERCITCSGKREEFGAIPLEGVVEMMKHKVFMFYLGQPLHLRKKNKNQ